MMGLHPCSVKKDFERELYIVEEWLSKRKFSAIGEIGTDLYWDKTFWEQQKEAFIVQIELGQEIWIAYRDPLSRKFRRDDRDIENLQEGNLRGIFHCFSGSAEQATRIFKLGFYLGIGGVVTFKNGGLDKVIGEITWKIGVGNR